MPLHFTISASRGGSVTKVAWSSAARPNDLPSANAAALSGDAITLLLQRVQCASGRGRVPGFTFVADDGTVTFPKVVLAFPMFTDGLQMLRNIIPKAVGKYRPSAHTVPRMSQDWLRRGYPIAHCPYIRVAGGACIDVVLAEP